MREATTVVGQEYKSNNGGGGRDETRFSVRRPIEHVGRERRTRRRKDNGGRTMSSIQRKLWRVIRGGMMQI